MKTLTTQILFAAAALTAVAMVAPAQTMKAEIPFAFSAGPYTMRPGSYDLTMAEGSRHITLRNDDTGKSSMLISLTELEAPHSARNRGARLRFDCASGRCVLREIWSAPDRRGSLLPGPKFGRHEAAQSKEITLTKVAAR